MALNLGYMISKVKLTVRFCMKMYNQICARATNVRGHKLWLAELFSLFTWIYLVSIFPYNGCQNALDLKIETCIVVLQVYACFVFYHVIFI